MPSRDKLSEFAAWCQSHITGDEKGQAQIFLDRLFQAFGQPGCLDVGGTTEFRIRKSGEDGGGTVAAVNACPRYIVFPRVSKRPTFAFVSRQIRPDMQLMVFAFEDDYSFGILQSSAHLQWFVAKCSKLTERFRYTSTTVFDTFPWPQLDASPSAARRDIVVGPAAKNRRSSVGATSSEYAAPDGAKSKSTDASYNDAAPDGASPPSRPSRDDVTKIDAAAAAARELRRVRAETLPKLKGGLRALYRTLEWTRSRPLARPSRACCFAKFLSPFPKRLKCPGANPLKDAHAALDAAVLAAYGFDAKKDLLAQLLALNLEVAAKIERGEPVTAPGVPKNYPDPQKLVTEDCIRPPTI